jgi:hypothetical protein
MSCRRFALAALAASFVAGSTYGASAQASPPKPAAGSCFELILPERRTQLPSPLLFNRCTGATWVLVKSGSRSVYRWVSLEIDDPLLAGEKDRVAGAPKPQAKPSAPGEKCFEFTGRRFCE